MRYLLDTSALSDLIKGSPKVAERLQLHGSDNTGISVITRGERCTAFFGYRPVGGRTRSRASSIATSHISSANR